MEEEKKRMKEEKRRKQRIVSQRTIVRRRLESLQDAEMGLSKTYSTLNMTVQHPTSSPVPEGIIDNSKEEDLDDDEFDETLPPRTAPPPTTLPPMTPMTPKISKPIWFRTSQQKAQEREKQRQERLRKHKIRRNNRLELVLKLFREVDGKFQHAANISIEKRFGVDNRARFECLKKDKLGVWRT